MLSNGNSYNTGGGCNLESAEARYEAALFRRWLQQDTRHPSAQ